MMSLALERAFYHALEEELDKQNYRGFLEFVC